MEFSAPRARDKLARLHEAEQVIRRAQADKFRTFAEFADEYRSLENEGPVLNGTERLVQWGGDGTPSIAEFCVMEVAAALATSVDSVRLRIGYALAVRHRLPSVWAAVMSCRVVVWQAEELARTASDLSFDEAIMVDAEIAPMIGSVAHTRLVNYLKGRVMQIRQVEAQSEHDRLKAQCGVEFEDSAAGFTRMWATLPAAEAVFLKARIDQMAVILGKCPAGTSAVESLEMRHALALGVLASPAFALHLLQADVQDELPMLDPECPAAGMRAHACGTITVDPQKLLPTAELVVHLTDQCLRDGDGVARGEQVGPSLAGWLKDMLAHARVRVRPVLDAGNQVPTDAYECPPRMREAVELRNPYEVFPFSKRLAKGADIDHTQRWRHITRHQDDLKAASEQVPPTRLGNLGPLSRPIHRAKTFGGWRLTQIAPGVFVWNSPLGFGYLVTPSQSWLINDPTGRIVKSVDNSLRTG